MSTRDPDQIHEEAYSADGKLKMPTVSIITLTYNQEGFVGKCIESVLAQTCGDWEQIIVDDGSTDKTAAVVKRYCLKDKRVRLVEHKHVGVQRMAELYNIALAVSKGKLIAVLEGDDYWSPWKLEKQIPAFDDESVVLTWGKAIVVDEKGQHLSINPPHSQQYLRISKGEAVRRLLLGCFYIPALTVMCRRSSLESIGGFRQGHGHHGTDYPTMLALAPHGDFRFIDSVLGYWVLHGSNVSAQFSRSTAWCSCSIDAFNSMPVELKKQTGLTLSRLVRLVQQRADTNLERDLEHDYSQSRFVTLLGYYLDRNALKGISPQVPREQRRLDIQHELARHAIWRSMRLLRKHDRSGSRRNSKVAFTYASAPDRLIALLLLGYSHVPIDLSIDGRISWTRNVARLLRRLAKI